MLGWINENFQWLLAFHIVAVVCWFAALFYLPRLFVYHSMADDREGIERFKVMERKLYRGIANPSMIATIVLGGLLISANSSYYFSSLWFQLKLAAVILLVAYHHMCLYFLKQLKRDKCSKSHVYFRWFNEFPVLLLIAIVLLVKLKPF